MNIIKKTERLRYFIVPLMIKYLTPSLYAKIKPIIKDTWGDIPRPSIMVMKQTFNNRVVKGAEIGVHRGDNAKSILCQLNIEKLFLIDAWENYEEIEAKRPNIEGNYEFVLKEFRNDDRIEIIRDFSTNAVKKFKDNYFDFVYIDANHLFDFAYQDISLWFKKVKPRGIVAGHDIFKHSGVLKAVKSFCSEKGLLFHFDLPDWYLIKERD